MRSLTVVYNKNQDEEPIKSAQPVSHMEIDCRNNIYLAVGAEIRIYSLRRLSKGKDFMIDVLKMDKILQDKVKLESDSLTSTFNDPESELVWLKEYLIGEDNKLLNSEVINKRILTLNQHSMFIKGLSVSMAINSKPNLAVLLTTGHLIVLAHTHNRYECLGKQATREVRVSKYIKDNILAVVNEDLTIKVDDSEHVLFKEKMKQRISTWSSSCCHSWIHLVMGSLERVVVMALKDYRKVWEREVTLQGCIDFLQMSHFHPDTVYVGTFKAFYSLDFGEQRMEVSYVKQILDQKVLLHDDQASHTSKSYKENSITRLLAQTSSGLLISLSFDLGSTFKELNMAVSSPDEYQLLKRCLDKVNQFYTKTTKHPLNFHDLRMLQNKSTLLELEKIALILNDNALTSFGKSGKQRKTNQDILDKGLQVVTSLGIPPNDIPVISQKLLLHVLLSNGESKKETFHELIAEVVKQRLEGSRTEVRPELVWKRCMYTFQKLAEGHLLQCIQCKLMGNKHSGTGEEVCYACWGQLKIVSAD